MTKRGRRGVEERRRRRREEKKKRRKVCRGVESGESIEGEVDFKIRREKDGERKESDISEQLGREWVYWDEACPQLFYYFLLLFLLY